MLFFCVQFRQKRVWNTKTLAELLQLSQLGLDGNECEEVIDFIQDCDRLDEGDIVEDSGCGINYKVTVLVFLPTSTLWSRLALSKKCGFYQRAVSTDDLKWLAFPKQMWHNSSCGILVKRAARCC